MKRITLLLLILLTCVGCDQATKSVAQQHLAEREPIALFNGVLHLVYAENSGAFLSLGTGLAPEVRTWLFTALVSLLLLGLLIFTLVRINRQPLGVTLALTLYLAGGMGNLIDRFLNDGHVIDFMVLGVGFVRTGVFNVADMLIMVGAGLLLFTLVQSPTEQSVHSSPRSSLDT